MICQENQKGNVCITTEAYVEIAGTAASYCFGVKGIVARAATAGLYNLLPR
mgnify:CR=1 FL=1